MTEGPHFVLSEWSGGAIRTLDLLTPSQVRYQAAPRPEADESTIRPRHARRSTSLRAPPCVSNAGQSRH